MNDNYKPVIGLEIHAQLNTNSKLFSSDKNGFGDTENENISAITLAHPGTLPMLNEAVFPLAIKLGLSCNCEINRINYFDRKNYFYPDLPKGYQITQDAKAICIGGFLDLHRPDRSITRVHFNRMHIEEDAGKSKHSLDNTSKINFNRAGVPLLEIVTEPCIHDDEIAGILLTEMRKRLRWLDVGNGNMEEGSLRCDVNVSLMKHNDTQLGQKVEIKNLNSIKNVKIAVKNEIKRQTSILDSGGKISSLTRNFDATTGQTTPLRSKEELSDYRYFPDPDITPYIVSDKMIQDAKKEIHILPETIYNDIIDKYGMTYKEADFITHDKTTADYFINTLKFDADAKKVALWVMGIINPKVKDLKTHLSKLAFKPNHLADLLACIKKGDVTHTMATQKVFPFICDNGGDINSAIKNLGLKANSNSVLQEKVIEDVLEKFKDKVEEYKKGKKGLLQLFIGQCMKALHGKADAKALQIMIKQKID